MRTPWRKRRREPAMQVRDEPPLALDVTSTPYGALVSIAGELDLATVPRVRAAFATEPVTAAGALVVDLGGVSFMDSTGLTVLIELQRDVGERRRRLAIACPEGAARLLFDVSGVADKLPLHWTREEAERSVAAP